MAMTIFFFIPVAHDALLAQGIALWEQNNVGLTAVCAPLYKENGNALTGNSPVKNFPYTVTIFDLFPLALVGFSLAVDDGQIDHDTEQHLLAVGNRFENVYDFNLFLQNYVPPLPTHVD